MESIHPQIEDLTANINDLEHALLPIIKTALSCTTSKLPLLDKAKLYVLATYAIESILFSYLRLNGVDAKSHPVFQELTRVKENFNKIKTAETAGVGSKNKLDKRAAGRFIKAGLSGNDKYDAERKARQEGERAGAKRKLEAIGTGTHTRFDGASKRIKEADERETIAVVKASEISGDEDLGKAEKEATPKQKKKKGKRPKRQENQGEYADIAMFGEVDEDVKVEDWNATTKHATGKKVHWTDEERADALLERRMGMAATKKQKRLSGGTLRPYENQNTEEPANTANHEMKDNMTRLPDGAKASFDSYLDFNEYSSGDPTVYKQCALVRGVSHSASMQVFGARWPMEEGRKKRSADALINKLTQAMTGEERQKPDDLPHSMLGTTMSRFRRWAVPRRMW